MFQLSSFDTPIPTDAWTLSNFFLRPQRAHNLSLEYVKTWGNAGWTTTVGTYYRKITEVKEYADFADLVANRVLEAELVPAGGRAYGVEWNVQKTRGNLRGSLSYTWSRTERKTNGERIGKIINGNEWYPANFDKPHELNFLLELQFNRIHSFTLTFNYFSGRPTTAPIGFFDVDGQTRIPIYSNRNALRIPDYHRLDIAYTIGQSLRRKKKWKSSLTVGIYNVYGRKNAYSVFFTQGRFAEAQANKLSVLGSAFPAITYNFNWENR